MQTTSATLACVAKRSPAAPKICTYSSSAMPINESAAMTAKPYGFTILLAALTTALAPAYVIRWHVGFYPTTLLESFILLTVTIFAIETVRQRTRLEWTLPITRPALFFLLAGAISVLVAPNRVAGLGLYRAFMIEPIAFAFVLAAVVTTTGRAKLVLSGFGLAGLVAGLFNSAVVLAALRTHAYQVTETPPVVIYISANDVALFLVPLIAIAGSLLLYSLDYRARVLSLLFLAGAVPATLLSFSRGGYLALAVVAIILALSHRRRIWLLSGIAGAGALLLLLTPIGTRIAVQLQNGYGNTVIGSRGRVYLWSTALQILREQPLFGTGLSTFYPHNLLLNFWVETGLLGVLAFAWLLFATFRVSWRGWREAAGEWRPVHFGVLLALVAIMAHGLVDVPYFKNDLSLEFWAIVGLTWAGTRLAAHQAPGTASNPHGRRPASVQI
jgi:O-antigen ligase